MSSLGGQQLSERFWGCLVGALVGDCLGAPFEDEYSNHAVDQSELANFLNVFLIGLHSNKKLPSILPYTDDTVMTWNIAQSLIHNQGFNAADMANRFAMDYFCQPGFRGYGLHVVNVFKSLRAKEYLDVFEPARRQFDGSGSYGNGGAMRISPVALFCYNHPEQLIEMAKNSTLLTHAHRDGYNGAILQCLAVHLALQSDPNKELDREQFLDSLITSMEALEPKQDVPRNLSKEPWSTVGLHVLRKIGCPKELIHGKYDMQPYCTKLRIMKHLLTSSDQDITPTEAFQVFGHGIAAVDSVPIALYSFLRAQRPVPTFQTDNPFVRALYLSIASGGDTDTIATMACAISGAYHGIASIPEGFMNRCEESGECRKIADELLAAAMKK